MENLVYAEIIEEVKKNTYDNELADIYIRELLDQTTITEIEKLDSISFEASEICKTLENFLNQELDHSSLEKIDDRVSDYKKLSQKHSIEPDLLKTKLVEIEKKLQLSEESSLNMEKLANKLKDIEKSDFDDTQDLFQPKGY